MIGSAHNHDRTKPMLIAPARQNLTFGFGSGYRSRDPLDQRHAKRLQLTDCPCGRVFVGKPPTNELAIHPIRKVGEHRDAHSDTGVNEVGRLKYPGAAGINRDDDDVGRLHGIGGD